MVSVRGLLRTKCLVWSSMSSLDELFIQKFRIISSQTDTYFLQVYPLMLLFL